MQNAGKNNKKILLIGGCGYIGSTLYQFLQRKNYVVDTVDLEQFGNVINKNNMKKNYKSLSKNFLSEYSVVILLAGHSSVQMCETHRLSSFKNNVDNFVQLLEKLTDQVFIYASSSTVYGKTMALAATEVYDKYSPANYYDLTKKIIDYYAGLSNIKYYGLRFATVNGWSPNLRVDIMINKMYFATKMKERIFISNKTAHRPVLGTRDLCRAIETIITKTGKPGIYNVASFNSTIEKIATTVASMLGTVLEEREGPPTYDYSVSTEKFEKEFQFQFSDTVESILSSLKKTTKGQVYSERL